MDIDSRHLSLIKWTVWDLMKMDAITLKRKLYLYSPYGLAAIIIDIDVDSDRVSVSVDRAIQSCFQPDTTVA